MLITVYQRTFPGLRVVNEYYWWRVEQVTELREAAERRGEHLVRVGVMPCPGCGRQLSRQTIRYSHQCTGSLTDRPIEPRRAQKYNPYQAEERIREYIANSRAGQITTSDE